MPLVYALVFLFQSTPPRGWRPWRKEQLCQICVYFNPLHHEGGDSLARSACLSNDWISIHSTTRVETICILNQRGNGRDFNPLHHEGGDVLSLATAISILHFNPLHHEGGDHQILIMSVLFNYFNPLHHEGGDWCGALTPAAGINFNPLHHEGGDARFVDWRMKISISIHSTTRVETCSQASIANSLMISIHSTTRVETIGVSRTSIISVDFNPLHHEGGDAVRATGSPRESISIHSTTRVETLTGRLPTAGLGFQSTPPRGWRHQFVSAVQIYMQFQSTPPRGWRLLHPI